MSRNKSHWLAWIPCPSLNQSLEQRTGLKLACQISVMLHRCQSMRTISSTHLIWTDTKDEPTPQWKAMKLVSRRKKKSVMWVRKSTNAWKAWLLMLKALFWFFRIRSPVSRHHSLYHLDSSSLASLQSPFPAFLTSPIQHITCNSKSTVLFLWLPWQSNFNLSLKYP